jgi:hypothetical protein
MAELGYVFRFSFHHERILPESRANKESAEGAQITMMPDTTSNETPADLVNAGQLALATSREVAKADSDPPALPQHDAASGALANSPAANAVADQDADSAQEPDSATTGKAARSTRRSATATLLRIAERYDLFHSPDGTGYADIDVDGHRETLALRSRETKGRLEHEYLLKVMDTPPHNAVQSTISTLETRAKYQGPERSVHVRVADQEGHLFLDLADKGRRAIEISTMGWSVVDNPPVRFCRPAGMRPLPVPEKGGSIDDLRQFLNLRDDNDFVLIVAWLLAAFRPQGPYAVLAVSGGQGSAKSSLSKLVRSLVDPNVSPVRSIPSKTHDIFIAAKSGHVVPFDNISSLSNWISDALCQLATGAGYVARQLRTDSDQVFFEASRPIILNGIGGFVDRSDLADRTLFISLPPISSYRPEDELRKEFDAAQPPILGALLDAVACGLRTLPNVCPDNRWRMADFAKFATACECAFRTPGTFAAAYSNNREQAIGEMLDADPIADAVVEVMKATAKWQGTAAQLLDALAKVAGSSARERGWPKTPGLLSRRLTRSEPLLRGRGIEVTRDRAGRRGDRLILLTKREPES